MDINNKLFLDVMASEGSVTHTNGWEGQNPRYSIELDKDKQIKVYVTDSRWNPMVTVETYIDTRYRSKILNYTKAEARAIRKHCKVLYDERKKVSDAYWAKHNAEQALKPTDIDLFLMEYYSDRPVS